MKELFSIGRISKLFHLPVSTIRYYCDIGLVTPAQVDEATGYRYFSADQFELLNTIKYLQALGMPLREISVLLKNRTVEGFVAQLEKQREETERQLRELREIRDKLTARVAQICDAKRSELIGCIREEKFPERDVVVLRRSIEPESDLEMNIRILENSSDMESAVFLGKVGLSVSEEDLKAGRFGNYCAVFLLVENETCNPRMLEHLPAGRYAVLRYSGTHRDAAAQYRKLLQYLESSGLAVRGASVEITLVDFGMTNDPSQFITEIQIPVEKTD